MARRSFKPAEWKFDSKDPWDPNTIMIVPVEKDQTILPELAAIYGMRSFLNHAGLNFKEVEKFNASAISPNGKLPVIKCGDYVVSEMDGVIQLAMSKGHSLTTNLGGTQKADLRACMSLVKNVLGNAMLYYCWIDKEVYEKYTVERVSSPYSFPLNYILPWVFRRKARENLSALQWTQKDPETVYNDVETCLLTISNILGKNDYFYGSSATELDALVFGYLYAMLTVKLPLPDRMQLGTSVKKFRNLMSLVERLEYTVTSSGKVRLNTGQVSTE